MKSIKLLFVLAAMLLASNIGYSQSSKAKDNAVEKTEELNNELKSENPALALSETQKGEITDLYMGRINQIAAFKENNSNESEVKAFAKELNKELKSKINSDIFTSEQAAAYKVIRKKYKGDNDKAADKGKGPIPAMSSTDADKVFNAASDKQKAKAAEATEELNQTLIASDPSLALSDDQRKQVISMTIKSLLERERLQNAGASKQEVKELSKTNRKAVRSILTKAQKSAVKKKK